MASVQINRGNTQEINATPITDGLILFDTEGEVLYADDGNQRKKYSNNITPNPQEASTDDLSKIKLDGTVYDITDLDRVDWESNGVLGAKNLLNITLSKLKSDNINGTWNDNVYTFNGGTYTILTNEIGNVVEVLANGTFTDTATLRVYYSSTPLSFPYEVILNGCPENGSISTYQLDINDGSRNERGNGLLLSENTQINNIRFRMAQGTYSNVSFKPMIRVASDTDATFQPYSMTNKELTQDKIGWKTNNLLGAKNLLENNVVDNTVGNVTITKNLDGSLTIDGTLINNNIVCWNMQSGAVSTDTQNDMVKHIPNGIYISSGSVNGISIQIMGTNTSGTSGIATILQGNGKFTIDNTYAYNYARILVNAGTYDNVTIYPMIRVAEDTDSTYQPYAKTNQELTKETIYRKFSVASSSWVTNTDPNTNVDYPYIATISTNVYNNNSVPIWQMNGVGLIPTETERNSIDTILEAVFSNSGIVLYANNLPTSNLVLEVKGE